MMNIELSRYCDEIGIQFLSAPFHQKKELKKYDHISRSGIFRSLWVGTETTATHKEYLMDHYPQLGVLFNCIREFREIYQRRSMPLLYLFIEKYKNSTLKKLSRFSIELGKDLVVVENSVASPMSNGFVEGANRKLKMVKRTMYGRCNRL